MYIERGQNTHVKRDMGENTPFTNNVDKRSVNHLGIDCRVTTVQF